MRPGRMLQLIAEIDVILDRAAGYLGSSGASTEELLALDRVRTAREEGSSEDVLRALVEAGALQQCPNGFWREIERAANLVIPRFSPCHGPVESARREVFHEWIQRRGQADAE